MSKAVFCSEKNLESCFEMLSKELYVLGFSKVFYQPDNVVSSVISMVNVFWKVLQAQKQNNNKCNQVIEKNAKLLQEVKKLEQDIKYLKSTVQRKESEIEKVSDALRKESSEREANMKDFKDMKLEVTKLKSTLLTQRSQYERDLKKQELLVGNLQDQLFKLVKSKTGAENTSRMCENEGQNSAGDKESTRNTLLTRSLCQLDNNLQIVLIENASIRNTLLKLYREVADLRYFLNDECRFLDSQGAFELPEYLFLLPYEELLNRVEENIEVMVNCIKTRLENK